MKRIDEASRNVVRFSCTSVMLAGTLLVGASTPAQAGQNAGNNHGGFRQFVQNNPGINRNTLRQIYRQHYAPGANKNPGEIRIPTIPPNVDLGGDRGAGPRAGRLNPSYLNGNNRQIINNKIRNNSFQLSAAGRAVRMNSGVDLLLDSDVANITLGGRLFDQAGSIEIEVGGVQKTVTAGSQVTAAEYIAAKQVLSAGGQSIQIDASGKAVGGSVDLSSITGKGDRLRADDFSVPVNVSAYGDFAKGSTFRVLGDLVNSGSIYAFSSGNRNNGTIRADNITNELGALISTKSDPASNNFNLTLHADNSFTNSGEVASSGNLNILSPTINNTGHLKSVDGNVTLDSPVNSTLTINNVGGTVSALNGAINLRDASYGGAFDATITGGDLLSKEVNMNAGQGVFDLNVNELTGTLNQKGLASHVTVSTGNLELGTICLTGDPTYFNDAGDITLKGDISVGEDLVIAASGDIVNSTSLTISTNKGNKSFPITLIAGANIMPTTGDTPDLGPIPPNVDGTAITIVDQGGGNIASTSGGSVLLNGVTITTANSGAGSDGSNVTIAAIQGADADSGRIIMDTSSIFTGGGGKGVNGSVTLIAGGDKQAILTPFIDTTGGIKGGTVSITQLQPIAVGGNIIYNKDGTLGAGGNIGVASTGSAGELIVASDIKASGNILLQSGPDSSIVLNEGVTVSTGKGAGVFFEQIAGTTAKAIFLEDSFIDAALVSFLTDGNVGTLDAPLVTNANSLILNSTSATDFFVRDTNSGLISLEVNNADLVNLQATGSIINGATSIKAAVLELSSSNGSIGLNKSAPLTTDVQFLTADAPNGNVFISDVAGNDLKLLGDMVAKGMFNVLAADKLSSNAIITAPTIDLTAGQFSAFGAQLNGSTTVKLTSADLQSTEVSAVINTKLLQLTSTTGDIGASGNRFVIGTGTLAVQAKGTDEVWLQGPAGLKTFTVSGSAGSIFDYNGLGNTTAGTITTGSDNLNVVTKGGSLTLAANATLTSGKDLTFQINDSTPEAKKFKLTLGKGSTIQTKAAGTDGKIFIGIGAPQKVGGGPAPTKGVSFATTPGNTIEWPELGLKAKGKNTVFAKGANVTINNTISAKNLVLAGNVAIIADPPVTLGGASSSTITGGASTGSNSTSNTSVKQHNAGTKHVRNNSVQNNQNGKSVSVTQGVDIDLSSIDQNITLGGKLFDKVSSVTIEVGGEEKTLQVGDQVTAAEFVAAKQVLIEGSQRLVLNDAGAAVGGDVDFSTITGKGDRMRVDDLSIPVDISVFSNFARGGSFQVTGDLLNAGSLYALSTGARRGGSIHADSILNQSGAVITSNLSSAPRSFDNARAEVDLTLRADSTFTNHGEISLSGNLNIDAPSITNTGLIESANGNVTLDTAARESLTIDNSGGTINALLGDINVRERNFKAAFDTTITGGDLFSQNFNINTGTGIANVDVGELTGVLGARGTAAHVWAKTQNLQLGKICLTGDPTFSNMDVNGDITLTDDITVGEALVIIASRNISNKAPLTITANNDNQGFPVTLIAGADITAGGSIKTLPDTKLPDGVLTTISGKASASGGNIDFNSQGTVFINTRAKTTTGDRDGGDVLLAAYYSGTGTTSGFIRMTGGFISTGGRGTGTNGDVTLIAGGDASTTATQFAIITPVVITTGGSGGGGDISVLALQPMSSDGKDITFDKTGLITTGNSLVADPAAIGKNGRISVLGNLLGNETVTIQSAGSGSTNGGIRFGFNLSISTADKANGVINLIAEDKTNTGNIDPSFSATFFSTNTLNLKVGKGDVGISEQLALGTNAQFITAFGDGGKAGTSDILIFDTNPGITFAEGSASQFNLTTVGTTMSTPGKVIAGKFVLLGSTSADTGLSDLNPVEVDAETLFAGNSKGGRVFIHNQNTGVSTLDGGAPFNADVFSVVSEGNLSMINLNTINARTVNIETKGSFTNFAGTINGSESVTLTAAKDILANNITAKVNSPILTLNSAGKIGEDASKRFTANTGTKTALVANATDVFLQGGALKTFTIGGGTATGVFDVLGAGTTLIAGDITSGGDLKISTPSGNLTVDEGVSLLSGNNMTLEITNTTTPTKSKLTIGKEASLNTLAAPGFGDITLSVGAKAPTPVAGTPPANVNFAEFGGGEIFWGTKGVSAKGANINLVAKGADIIFNNEVGAKNIVLSANSTIVADPPVTSNIPTRTNMSVDSETGLLTALSVPHGTTDSPFGATAGAAGSLTSPAASNNLYALQSAMNTGLTPDMVSVNELASSNVANIFGAFQSLSNTVTTQAYALTTTQDQRTSGLGSLLVDAAEDDSYIVAGGSLDVPGAICGEQYLFDAIDAKRGLKQIGVSHIDMTDQIEMPAGAMLVLASRSMNISTPVGQLSIEPGSVVLLSRTEAGVSVYNMHDSKKESVAIQAGGRRLSVAPGSHVTVTRHKTDFASLNAIEAIGHRALNATAVNNELTAHSSEFSTLSAMACVTPLKALMSSDHPEAKKLANKMMKTTAILMHLGGNQGQYQSYAKARMTALVK